MKPKINKYLVVLSLLPILIIGFSGNPVFAQQESPQTPTDDEVNAIAKELYCPVCENIPLDVCPTQACAEWRELIRLKLSEGWNADQIKDYFAEQYGTRVLATPPARGFNILIFIIPAIGILAGIFILIKAFKSFQKFEDTEEVFLSENQLEDKYINQLEKEINT
jgi:cytochrome c-type biogenesis protein CcmH